MAYVVAAATAVPKAQPGPGIFVTQRDLKAVVSRATTDRGDRRVRSALIVAQLALTVVLLTTAGILFRSLNRLVHRMSVSRRQPLSGEPLPTAVYGGHTTASVLSGSAHASGVVPAFSIGMTDEVPGGGSVFTTFQVSDQSAIRCNGSCAASSAGHIETMGARIIAGRVRCARPHRQRRRRRSGKLARLIETAAEGAVGRLLQLQDGKRVAGHRRRQ
jgi:hypothetical protein